MSMKKCTQCGGWFSTLLLPKTRKRRSNLRCASCDPEQFESPDKKKRARVRVASDEELKASRNRYLKSSYGITAEQYDVMFEEQGGLCAICLEPSPNRRLAVDHNHLTGEIRGLLCAGCNTSLGFLKADNGSELLIRAIWYIDGR